ncbi:MAG: hypothetical protein HXY53_07160 [Nitrospirae bacterium]|nr:hypothetical protein [Nitrospirota bacterium]
MSKMPAFKLIFLWLLIMVLLGAYDTASSQSTQNQSILTGLLAEKSTIDGATLLETRCSLCHSADRAKQAKKTREQWDKTVTRMISKGAQLTEAEKTLLLDYLAKTYGQ